MKNNVFNKDISPSCEYCVYGKKSSFENEILCKKHGVTEIRDYCKKYKYDALKRIPKNNNIKENYKAEDFSL